MPTSIDSRLLVSFSIILVLFLGSSSVSSAFSRVFCPQTNTVGLNFNGSRTANFELSSTPQGTTSFYEACDSIYIIINNENHLHSRILQVQQSDWSRTKVLLIIFQSSISRTFLSMVLPQTELLWYSKNNYNMYVPMFIRVITINVIAPPLSIGRCGEHLQLRQWIFGFCKMRRISWLAENLLASQEESVQWSD